MNIDELLECFETQWNAGEMPDVFAFVERCPADDLMEAASELIEIDIERRWQSGNPDLPMDLSRYLEILPNVFSTEDQISLICAEYRIRNQWGDCISRRIVLEKYSYLGDNLLSQIVRTSQSIDWPVVSVAFNGQTLVETRLDREITAGRQIDLSQDPWSVVTNTISHHIVLCHSADASLSRHQLAVSRHTPNSVLLQNTSENRAVAVRGRGAVDFGASLVCRLPVFVHLGAARYLRICNSASLSESPPPASGTAD